MEVYSFPKEAQEKLFTKVTKELRCSVCQNQNLRDSNARVAIDLRNEIYRQVLNGESEARIIEFVTSRYGDFVLYNPPLQTNTFILWFGPIIFVILAVTFLIRKMKLP
jgi:cytochrome c-type biogenesis protein CcmH